VSSHVSRLTAFDIAADDTLSNRRVWADGVGPDGICLDAEGCIWASSGSMINDCARIREGGEVLATIEQVSAALVAERRRVVPRR
jgi:sugar lactone lactonase YvrE